MVAGKLIIRLTYADALSRPREEANDLIKKNEKAFALLSKHY